MHRLLCIALVSGSACLLPATATPALAQCATGCSSSSSCGGSGKSGCSTACGSTDGVEWCSCSDTHCGTTILPQTGVGGPAPGYTLASAPLEARALAASLVTDCQGNIVDVLIVTSRDGSPVFGDVGSILLAPPPPLRAGRVAVRE
jgi:hypothetical protein